MVTDVKVLEAHPDLVGKMFSHRSKRKLDERVASIAFKMYKSYFIMNQLKCILYLFEGFIC